MDQPVVVSPETTAAFVGRALRGPLNAPVLVRNFAEFRRRFGDIWNRSSLGPAVHQFFAHGGRRLYVVRVANNARGALICLPASGSALVLRAVEPGSTESIRAAVDYDGIEGDECFNLTLQRMDPATRLVVDQELFSRVSFSEESDDFVGNALLGSTMVRAEQPYPTHRPEATLRKGRPFEADYVSAAQAGTDGVELSDYDLIGSRKARTGLFALDEVDDIDLLYLPAPAKGSDIGPTAVLAADQFCRERGAMLLVDPHAEWQTAEEAVQGVRELGYASPNMIGYFPRLRAQENPDELPWPAGAVIAGLLCKQDRMYGPWRSLDQQGLGLDRKLMPAVELDDEDAHLLNRAGLNAVTPGPAGKARVRGCVTMSRGSEAHREFTSLAVRRFCLRVVNTIAQATRWAVFEPRDEALAKRVRGQILTYLDCLNDLDAFADERFVVECDAGVSHRADGEEHGVTILLGFHPAGSDERVSLTLHLTAKGCRVGTTAFGPTIDDES